MIDLSRERSGFSGVNHVLIAIMLSLLLLMVPVEPFSPFLSNIMSSPVFGIMGLLTICGGALLPDMDNLKSDGGSAATWSLGALGSIVSSLMVTISSIVTSVFHGRRDVRPDTQHRFFWHTLLVPLVGLLLTELLVPDSSARVIDSVTSSAAVIIPLVLVAICIYVGAILLLKKICKVLPIGKPSIIALLLMVGSVLIVVFMLNEHQLKMLTLCVSLGYLFHLVGDLFADGGIPALFPVTGIFGKFFMRVRLSPVTVKTGSTLESLLKIVFLAIDLVLAYLVFFVAQGVGPDPSSLL